VLAMLGRFHEARKFIDDELNIASANDAPLWVGGLRGFNQARVEFLAGDFAAAIEAGEAGCAMLEDAGSPSTASSAAGIVAMFHFYAGNPDGAARWANHA